MILPIVVQMDIPNRQLITYHYTMAPDNAWLHSCGITRRSAPTVPTCQHGGEQPAFGKWAFRAVECATCQGVWQVGLASGIDHAWASGNMDTQQHDAATALGDCMCTHGPLSSESPSSARQAPDLSSEICQLRSQNVSLDTRGVGLPAIPCSGSCNAHARARTVIHASDAAQPAILVAPPRRLVRH